MDQKEKELIEHCDAVLWSSDLNDKDGTIETKINFYRVQNKIKPTDIGYKYSILQFMEGDANSIEVFSAIIGSPRCYAERLGAMGYHGAMLKHKSCKKKDAKELFAKTLMNWGFEDKEFRIALKMV